MKFKKALSQLGPGQWLGMEGTDWSWYYKWEYSAYHCSMMLVDQDGKPRPLLWSDFEDHDWIVRDPIEK